MRAGHLEILLGRQWRGWIGGRTRHRGRRVRERQRDASRRRGRCGSASIGFFIRSVDDRPRMFGRIRAVHRHLPVHHLDRLVAPRAPGWPASSVGRKVRQAAPFFRSEPARARTTTEPFTPGPPGTTVWPTKAGRSRGATNLVEPAEAAKQRLAWSRPKVRGAGRRFPGASPVRAAPVTIAPSRGLRLRSLINAVPAGSNQARRRGFDRRPDGWPGSSRRDARGEGGGVEVGRTRRPHSPCGRLNSPCGRPNSSSVVFTSRRPGVKTTDRE